MTVHAQTLDFIHHSLVVFLLSAGNRCCRIVVFRVNLLGLGSDAIEEIIESLAIRLRVILLR